MSETIQKKRRATKRLVERTKQQTTDIYNKVKTEYLKSKGRFNKEDELLRNVFGFSRLSEEEENEISELYKEELTKLPTKDLEDMLIAHNAGKYRRRSDTLHVVEMELARRAILNDSNEK